MLICIECTYLVHVVNLLYGCYNFTVFAEHTSQKGEKGCEKDEIYIILMKIYFPNAKNIWMWTISFLETKLIDIYFMVV